MNYFFNIGYEREADRYSDFIIRNVQILISQYEEDIYIEILR